MRPLIIVTVLVCAGCSAPETRLSARHDYAARRFETPVSSSAVDAPSDVADVPGEPGTPPARDAGAELAGILAPPAEDLVARLREDADFSTWLEEPRTLDEVLAATWSRHPDIAAHRRAWLATGEEYVQVAYLDDLAHQYRGFLQTGTVKPMSPSPPYPSMSALRRELVRHRTEAAWQDLRATVSDRLAAAVEAVAARRYAAERVRVAAEHVTRAEDLVKITRSRVSTGSARQSDLLGAQALHARARIDLATAREGERDAARTLDALLVRTGGPAPTVTGTFSIGLPLESLETTAAAGNPGLLASRARLEGRRVALRLADVMTTPTAPIGKQRPARHAESSTGPRSAVIRELRLRVDQAEHDVAARELDVRTRASVVRRRIHDARAVRQLQEEEVVPRVRSAWDGIRGAWRGGRSSYLDVDRALRELLDAELALARARRDEDTSHAALLRVAGRRNP